MSALLQTELNADIEEAEGFMLDLLQCPCELVERFAPGVYLRELTMPAGAFIIGHEHKTAHFNIILSGRALVSMNGEVAEIVAGATFVSQPGVRKVLYIVEEMTWQTVHPTDETDPAKLEAALIVKSATWQDHARELEDLKEALK